MTTARTVILGTVLAALGCGESHVGTETGNPPVIDARRIGLMEAEQGVRVVGEPGAVNPGGTPVEVDNVDDDAPPVSQMSQPDGSFNVQLEGSVDDRYTVQAVAVPDESVSPTVLVTSEGTLQLEDGQDVPADIEGNPVMAGPDEPREPVVDLVFVIDNSNSMAEEQEQLANQLPRMVQILTTGDRNLDGDTTDPEDFGGLTSLHLGVVSTNMGAAGNDVPGCVQQGDDGLLIAGSDGPPDCLPGRPGYLTFDATGDSAMDMQNGLALGDDFACQVRLGTSGCGLEQPLDAMLKALVPSTAVDGAGAPITFFGGSTGHGDGAHSGFLRPDSTLAVVLVTDEDDCSVPDAASDLLSLDGGATYADEPLNLRCGNHEDDGTLHSMARYVQGLRSLRPNPDDLVFSVLAGIPVQFDDALIAGTISYTDLLAEPTMQFQAADEPVMADTLPVASCDTANGVAFPPRRLVRLAAALQDDGVSGTGVYSICRDDYSAAIDGLVDRIRDTLQI